MISGGLESAVLTELVGKECFPARSSISRKPLSKREQLWSSSHLAYVELCAAIPDVRNLEYMLISQSLTG